MGEHAAWDGSREQRPRVVVERLEFTAPGLSAGVVTEDIGAPTDWCFREPHHIVVVHLAGQLRRMESVFSKGPSTNVLPAVGDTWVIPAGCQYAALAQGDSVRFVEFALPAGLQNLREPAARVGHRDSFLHQACARLASVAKRNDDLGVMMQRALLDTVRVHLVDTLLGSGQQQVTAVRADPPARTFSARQKRLLLDHIAGHLSGTITVEDLAAAAALSKFRFLASFKASFGMTPWQYVLRFRLAEGRRLLESTDASVTAIAAAVGFSSPSHFATAFGKHFGISPARCRSGRGAGPDRELD